MWGWRLGVDNPDAGQLNAAHLLGDTATAAAYLASLSAVEDSFNAGFTAGEQLEDGVIRSTVAVQDWAWRLSDPMQQYRTLRRLHALPSWWSVVDDLVARLRGGNQPVKVGDQARLGFLLVTRTAAGVDARLSGEPPVRAINSDHPRITVDSLAALRALLEYWETVAAGSAAGAVAEVWRDRMRPGARGAMSAVLADVAGVTEISAQYLLMVAVAAEWIPIRDGRRWEGVAWVGHDNAGRPAGGVEPAVEFRISPGETSGEPAEPAAGGTRLHISNPRLGPGPERSVIVNDNGDARSSSDSAWRFLGNSRAGRQVTYRSAGPSAGVFVDGDWVRAEGSIQRSVGPDGMVEFQDRSLAVGAHRAEQPVWVGVFGGVIVVSGEDWSLNFEQLPFTVDEDGYVMDFQNNPLNVGVQHAGRRAHATNFVLGVVLSGARLSIGDAVTPASIDWPMWNRYAGRHWSLWRGADAAGIVSVNGLPFHVGVHRATEVVRVAATAAGHVVVGETWAMLVVGPVWWPVVDRLFAVVRQTTPVPLIVGETARLGFRRLRLFSHGVDSRAQHRRPLRFGRTPVSNELLLVTGDSLASVTEVLERIPERGSLDVLVVLTDPSGSDDPGGRRSAWQDVLDHTDAAQDFVNRYGVPLQLDLNDGEADNLLIPLAWVVDAFPRVWQRTHGGTAQAAGLSPPVVATTPALLELVASSPLDQDLPLWHFSALRVFARLRGTDGPVEFLETLSWRGLRIRFTDGFWWLGAADDDGPIVFLTSWDELRLAGRQLADLAVVLHEFPLSTAVVVQLVPDLAVGDVGALQALTRLVRAFVLQWGVPVAVDVEDWPGRGHELAQAAANAGWVGYTYAVEDVGGPRPRPPGPAVLRPVVGDSLVLEYRMTPASLTGSGEFIAPEAARMTGGRASSARSEIARPAPAPILQTSVLQPPGEAPAPAERFQTAYRTELAASTETAVSVATAAEPWSVEDLDRLLLDDDRVRILDRGSGRFTVWLPRDEAEAADERFKEAVARAQPPDGFAAVVFVHGSGGVASLLGRRLDGGDVARWLRRQGIHGDVFLPGCELLNQNGYGGFGVEVRDGLTRRVRATGTLGWLDLDTGVVIPASADEQGQPKFTANGTPAGFYADLPADGGPAMIVPPAVGVNPAAHWYRLADGGEFESMYVITQEDGTRPPPEWIVRDEFVTLVPDHDPTFRVDGELLDDVVELVDTPAWNDAEEQGWPGWRVVALSRRRAMSLLQGARQEAKTIGELFRNAPGFTIRPGAEKCVVRYEPRRRYVWKQQSHGVRPAILLHFLEKLLARATHRLDDPVVRFAVNNVHYADDWGRLVLRKFAGRRFIDDSEMRVAVRELGGFAALAFTEFAPHPGYHAGVHGDELFKKMMVVLSRTTMSGGHKSLLRDGGAFLELFPDELRRWAVEYYAARNPIEMAYLIMRVESDRPGIVWNWPLDILRLQLYLSEHTIGEHLASAFEKTPEPLVSQRAAVNAHTWFWGPDTNDRNLPRKTRFVLEARKFGEHFTTEDKFDQDTRELAAFVRAEERELPSDEDPEDPLGLLDTPTVGRHGGPHFEAIPAAWQVSFLHEFSVTNADEPRVASMLEISALRLRRTREVRLLSADGVESRTRQPRIVHAVVLGPNVEAMLLLEPAVQQAGREGFGFKLWTDIPRHEFEEADGQSSDGSSVQARHAGLRAFMQLAVRYRSLIEDGGFSLLHIDELFPPTAPMRRLSKPYRTELLRGTPEGKKRAALLVVPEILHRHNGIAMTPGSQFNGRLEELLAVDASGLLFAADADGQPSFAIMAAAAKSRGIRALLDVLAERYEREWAPLVTDNFAGMTGIDEATIDLFNQQTMLHPADGGGDLDRYETAVRMGDHPAVFDEVARILYGDDADRGRLATIAGAFDATHVRRVPPFMPSAEEMHSIEHVWRTVQAATMAVIRERRVRGGGIFLTVAGPIMDMLPEARRARAWETVAELLVWRVSQSDLPAPRWLIAEGSGAPVDVVRAVEQLIPFDREGLAELARTAVGSDRTRQSVVHQLYRLVDSLFPIVLPADSGRNRLALPPVDAALFTAGPHARLRLSELERAVEGQDAGATAIVMSEADNSAAVLYHTLDKRLNYITITDAGTKWHDERPPELDVLAEAADTHGRPVYAALLSSTGRVLANTSPLPEKVPSSLSSIRDHGSYHRAVGIEVRVAFVLANNGLFHPDWIVRRGGVRLEPDGTWVRIVAEPAPVADVAARRKAVERTHEVIDELTRVKSASDWPTVAELFHGLPYEKHPTAEFLHFEQANTRRGHDVRYRLGVPVGRVHALLDLILARSPRDLPLYYPRGTAIAHLRAAPNFATRAANLVTDKEVAPWADPTETVVGVIALAYLHAAMALHPRNTLDYTLVVVDSTPAELHAALTAGSLAFLESVAAQVDELLERFVQEPEYKWNALVSDTDSPDDLIDGARRTFHTFLDAVIRPHVDEPQARDSDVPGDAILTVKFGEPTTVERIGPDFTQILDFVSGLDHAALDLPVGHETSPPSPSITPTPGKGWRMLYPHLADRAAPTTTNTHPTSATPTPTNPPPGATTTLQIADEEATSADAILADLRAAGRPAADVEPAGLLGPDVFQLRRAPAPPAFLAGNDQDAIATDQLTSFFELLDMTRPDPPTNARLRPEALARRPETVWRSERGPDERSWAPREDTLPPEYRKLPEVMEMPLLFHYVRLGGGPLTGAAEESRSFLDNTADIAKRTRDWANVVLWTDVSRTLIAQASKPPPAQGPDPLRDVRDMVAWARANGIWLVNVDEVFHAQAKMLLDEEYRMELAKYLGVGYVSASGSVRLAILERFGGIYTDEENRFVRSDGLRRIFEEHGFAVHADEHTTPEGALVTIITNSAMLAARRHPFVRLYQNDMQAKYTRSQAELYGPILTERRTKTANKEWLWPPLLFRRDEVAERGRVPTWASYSPLHFPRLTQFAMGSAQSWMQQARSPLAPARRFSVAEAPAVARAVVATLIRELYNRDGDLHLTYAAPVVAGLPDPTAAWRAVIRYILNDAVLASRIRTVTDRLLRRIEHYPGDEDPAIAVSVVDLPADSREELGLEDPPPGEDPPGVWRLGELMRPYRPNRRGELMRPYRATQRGGRAAGEQGPQPGGLSDGVSHLPPATAAPATPARGRPPAPQTARDGPESTMTGAVDGDRVAELAQLSATLEPATSTQPVTDQALASEDSQPAEHAVRSAELEQVDTHPRGHAPHPPAADVLTPVQPDPAVTTAASAEPGWSAAESDTDTVRSMAAPRTPVVGAVGDGGLGDVVDGFELSGVGSDLSTVVGGEWAGRLETWLRDHVSRVVAARDELVRASDLTMVGSTLQILARQLATDLLGRPPTRPVKVKWVDESPALRAHFDVSKGVIQFHRDEAADLVRLNVTLVHEVMNVVIHEVITSDVSWGRPWAGVRDKWRASMTGAGAQSAERVLGAYQAAFETGTVKQQRVAFRAVFKSIDHEAHPRVVAYRFARLLDAAWPKVTTGGEVAAVAGASSISRPPEKAYLVLRKDIERHGLTAGTSAIGLYSAARKPGWRLLLNRRMYRVSLPAGHVRSVAEATDLDHSDVEPARGARQDLLLPHGELRGVRIDKVYRPWTTFWKRRAHSLVGEDLANLHEPVARTRIERSQSTAPSQGNGSAGSVTAPTPSLARGRAASHTGVAHDQDAGGNAALARPPRRLSLRRVALLGVPRAQPPSRLLEVPSHVSEVGSAGTPTRPHSVASTGRGGFFESPGQMSEAGSTGTPTRPPSRASAVRGGPAHGEPAAGLSELPAPGQPLSPETIENSYGIPRANQVKFQHIANKYHVIIKVRPSNREASRLLQEGLLPKPKEIKAKTANTLDVRLGVPLEHKGRVVYYLPPPVAPDRSWSMRLQKRFEQRQHEFKTLAPDMAQLMTTGRYQIDEEVVYRVGEDGSARAAMTGDHDVFELVKLNGERPSPDELRRIFNEMMSSDMAVEHGAHMDWVPETAFERAMFDSIVEKHRYGPNAEPLIQFRPNAESAVAAYAPPAPAGPSRVPRPAAPRRPSVQRRNTALSLYFAGGLVETEALSEVPELVAALPAMGVKTYALVPGKPDVPAAESVHAYLSDESKLLLPVSTIEPELHDVPAGHIVVEFDGRFAKNLSTLLDGHVGNRNAPAAAVLASEAANAEFETVSIQGRPPIVTAALRVEPGPPASTIQVMRAVVEIPMHGVAAALMLGDGRRDVDREDGLESSLTAGGGEGASFVAKLRGMQTWYVRIDPRVRTALDGVGSVGVDALAAWASFGHGLNLARAAAAGPGHVAAVRHGFGDLLLSYGLAFDRLVGLSIGWEFLLTTEELTGRTPEVSRLPGVAGGRLTWEFRLALSGLSRVDDAGVAGVVAWWESLVAASGDSPSVQALDQVAAFIDDVRRRGGVPLAESAAAGFGSGGSDVSDRLRVLGRANHGVDHARGDDPAGGPVGLESVPGQLISQYFPLADKQLLNAYWLAAWEAVHHPELRVPRERLAGTLLRFLARRGQLPVPRVKVLAGSDAPAQLDLKKFVVTVGSDVDPGELMRGVLGLMHRVEQVVNVARMLVADGADLDELLGKLPGVRPAVLQVLAGRLEEDWAQRNPDLYAASRRLWEDAWREDVRSLVADQARLRDQIGLVAREARVSSRPELAYLQAPSGPLHDAVTADIVARVVPANLGLASEDAVVAALPSGPLAAWREPLAPRPDAANNGYRLVQVRSGRVLFAAGEVRKPVLRKPGALSRLTALPASLSSHGLTLTNALQVARELPEEIVDLRLDGPLAEDPLAVADRLRPSQILAVPATQLNEFPAASRRVIPVASNHRTLPGLAEEFWFLPSDHPGIDVAAEYPLLWPNDPQAESDGRSPEVYRFPLGWSVAQHGKTVLVYAGPVPPALDAAQPWPPIVVGDRNTLTPPEVAAAARALAATRWGPDAAYDPAYILIHNEQQGPVGMPAVELEQILRGLYEPMTAVFGDSVREMADRYALRPEDWEAFTPLELMEAVHRLAVGELRRPNVETSPLVRGLAARIGGNIRELLDLAYLTATAYGPDQLSEPRLAAMRRVLGLDNGVAPDAPMWSDVERQVAGLLELPPEQDVTLIDVLATLELAQAARPRGDLKLEVRRMWRELQRRWEATDRSLKPMPGSAGRWWLGAPPQQAEIRLRPGDIGYQADETGMPILDDGRTLAASGGGAATFLYFVRSSLTPMLPVLRLIGVFPFGRDPNGSLGGITIGSLEFYWELRRYIERTALRITIESLPEPEMVPSAENSRLGSWSD